MNKLPANLYTPEAVSTLDRLAIESGIPGFTLMRRAGQAAFDVLCTRYPLVNRLVVFCGAGNNAGDGYVVARLARQQGLNVDVVSLIDPRKLKGDALQACQQWTEIGEVISLDDYRLETADIIVDALLGTGISREVDGNWKICIDAINLSETPVVAIDVPSGLDARTGAIQGASIRADVTVSFIGLKAGLFTASGKACCGEVVFNALDVPDDIYSQVDVAALLLDEPVLPERLHDTHKGHHGHVLVVGGNTGMPGSVILAARAALRTGAGLVSVLTRVEHVAAVATACPEAMVHGSVNGELPATLSQKISCVAIGPGLGQDAWAHRLLSESSKLDKPMVIDADALNLLTDKSISITPEHVITPHPGEAARLLSVQTTDIQHDRFDAAKQLYDQTGAIVVLKGSGTIVFDGRQMQVCSAGNPAMAVAGMGDVLTGVIASLMSQGMATNDAASAGVYLHASAGDRAALGNDRGMLASDVIEELRWASNK